MAKLPSIAALSRARHVFDDAARAVVQAAMGHRPRRQPAGRAHRRLRYETSNMPSTSTAASAGSEATPTVVRAWRPLSPKAATIRSDAPLSTFGPSTKVGRGIDEAAEPDHANHLVEVAERSLDLRQQVDGATARRGVALLDGDAGAELALGDQLALRVDANLAGHEQQISGAYETDVIRHRARRLMQDHALCRKFLLDRSRHVSSPSDFNSRPIQGIGPALFRASRGDMQARADRCRMPLTVGI